MESPHSPAQTLARLAESREEIRRLLDPPPEPPETPVGGVSGQFPRSRTMQVLTSGRGIKTVGAVVGGLLMARPALALRLIRVVPTGAVARVLLGKALSAIRSRRS
ncbi:MAG: hypothetical protein M3O06_06870 [Pseudomonadota bacterium]|nr:hypothetical protein [Pseudomonadota bacterium]